MEQIKDKIFKLIVFLVLSNNVFSTNYVNSLGTTGYYLTPSAYFLEQGSLAFSYANNGTFSRANFLAQPFKNLEVSMFYADIPNKPYPLSLGQSYKDKGFNIKYLLIDENKFSPSIAIGMSDIAGSGIFSGEYLVATKSFNNVEFNFGLGWGIYSKNNNFSNPLIQIDNDFEFRSSMDTETGNFDSDDYFSGKKIGVFAGTVYKIDNGQLIFEYNSFDSSSKFGVVKELAKFNLGYAYLGSDLVRPSILFDSNGNISFNISSSFNFLKAPKRKFRTFEQTSNPSINLVTNLQNNDIALKKISIDNQNNITVGIRQNSYLDQRQSVLFTAKSIESAGFSNTEEIVVKNYYFGEVITEDIYNFNEDKITRRFISNDSENIIFQNNNEQFYQIFEVNPALQTFIASREAFLKYALVLNFDYKIFFKENFFIDSRIKYSIYDNFDELYLSQ